MGEFADVLKEIGSIEASDLQILEGLATKYPALDNSVIRSREFSKKQAAWDREKSTLEATRKELEAKVSRWDEWRDQYWTEDPNDPTSGMTRAEKQAREELARTSQRLAEMEAGQISTGGVQMDQNDFAAVTAFLNEKGYVTKDAINGLAPKADLDAVKVTHGNMLAGFETIYTRATPMVTRYAREFSELGDDFDLVGFTTFLTSSPDKLQDVSKAYEEFVAPKKQQLEFKKESKRLEDLRAELEKKQADQAAAIAAAPSPTDTSASTSEVGHFQRRVMSGDKKEEGKSDAPLGSGVSAMIAAEQYRKGEFASKEVQ